MTERNALTPDQIIEQKENAQDKIKQVMISDFGYDIDEFFKGFDRAVVRIDLFNSIQFNS
jgi:hypothetical protein